MNAEQGKPIDEHPTSSSLLERIRKSDEMAWRQLSFLYTPLIQFWGRRSGLQDADAEDLVQEVLRSVNARFTASSAAATVPFVAGCAR